MLRSYLDFLSLHPWQEDILVLMLPFFTIAIPSLSLYRHVRPLPVSNGRRASQILAFGPWLLLMQYWLPPQFEPIGPPTEPSKWIFIAPGLAVTAYGSWLWIKDAGTNSEMGGAPPAAS